MNAETDTTAQAPDEVLNELRSLVREAEKIIGAAPAGNSEVSMAALRERLRSAQERLTEFYEDARRRMVDGAKYADETLREHPYHSIAIALGIGLLAGALLARRGNSPSE